MSRAAFFEQGFEVFQRPDFAAFFDDFPLDLITWTDDGGNEERQFAADYPLVGSVLTTLQVMIAQEYLKASFPKLSSTHARIWTSFTQDQLKYHNDTFKQQLDSSKFNEEQAQYNILALLYLTDMTSLNEGAVWFKSQDQETRLLPTKGMLVLVNCSRPEFQHKAEWTEHPRYLCQFGYKVDPQLL